MLKHLWRAIWPAASIMAVYISASLFDIWFILPDLAQPITLIATLLTAYFISRHALAKPNWGWDKDYGAKYLILMLLIISAAFAQDQAKTRIFNALKIQIYEPLANIKISAWIAPPTYTGDSHIHLAKEVKFAELVKLNTNLTMLEGSIIKFSFTGNIRNPRIYHDGQEIIIPAQYGQLFQQTVEMNQSGELRLVFAGNQILRWNIDVTRDLEPNIKFISVPRARPTNVLEVGYIAEDDYALEKITFKFRTPGEEGEDKTFSHVLPIANSSTSVEDMHTLDLSTNKWAGTMVMGWLSVIDARGQENTSDVFQFKLPQMAFSNPVARNIINIRKSLLIEPIPKEVLGQRLKLISENKDQINNDYVVYMALRTAYWRLSLSPSTDINLIAALLWNAALRLEENTEDQFALN